MRAEGVVAMGRSKVYAEGSRVRVPFTEVPLTNGESVRLYDTSGPGSDPGAGLAPLRQPWITRRDDVEEYEGRPISVRDDGRAAVRRGTTSDEFTGERRRPLRARAGQRVTQLHYA